MAILTVKHHDGFLLYPSRYTDHDVGSSSWRNGTGDVLREFVTSMHKYGIKAVYTYRLPMKTPMPKAFMPMAVHAANGLFLRWSLETTGQGKRICLVFICKQQTMGRYS